MNTAEQFWTRVDKNGSCWEWQGAVNNSGYGTALWGNKSVVASRLAAYLCGVIPSLVAPRPRTRHGFVLHKCDNRRCCRPTHLYVGTLSSNMKDAYQRGRKTQPLGQHHANAKLTASQVRMIRRKYANGLSQGKLAATYGVSQRAVSLVVRRETYTNVT